MTFTPEVTLGQKVLDLTTQRHQLIANNIANINTPKYKRTDLSFAATLEDMAEKTKSVEVNSLPDLMNKELIATDLSRGKQLTYLHGNSGGDMGVEYSKNDLGFDYEWFKQGADTFNGVKERKSSVSDVINETNPILIKTKNSERLDGNNVNVDMEVAEMIKNTSYYNILTSMVSADFRIYRTIISAR